MEKLYAQVIERLKKLDPLKLNDLYMFTGFDGFEDKIQRVVKSGRKDEVVFFPDIKEFGVAVDKAAGKSSQFRIETRYRKLGGNSPIMANAMGFLGIQNTCMASLGYPDIRPVFREMHPIVNPISVCEPGETNALEFNDGKLMMSDMTPFNELNWDFLLERAGKDRFLRELKRATVVALVDWANLDHASDIWAGIERDLLPSLSEPGIFFFDIADPSRKSLEEIREVVDIIGRYRKYGEVIFGINENETIRLHQLLSGKDEGEMSLETRINELYGFMDTDQLLVHPVDRCILIDGGELLKAGGTLVKNPKISTGGGDNFNAGYCFGRMNGFSSEESMILAMGTSGSYVKYGKSPTLDELADYLENPGD